MRYIVTSGYVKNFIVFSESECSYHARLFNVDQCMFRCVNLGFEDMTEVIPLSNKGDYFLSAGRSNRDYEFLYGAWKDDYGDLVIICDSFRCDNTKKFKSSITAMRMTSFINWQDVMRL